MTIDWNKPLRRKGVTANETITVYTTDAGIRYLGECWTIVGTKDVSFFLARSDGQAVFPISSSHFDLENVPPLQRIVWVNVYENGVYKLWESREQAERYNMGNRLHTLEINIDTGETKKHNTCAS